MKKYSEITRELKRLKKGKNFDKIRFMERESWYNKKIPIKYIFITFILICSSSIFLPRPELSCSKADNICNYYFVNFRGEKEIEQTFKISDIDTYEITSHTGGRGGMTTYTSIIYLKNGEEIEMDFRTLTYARTDDIVQNILTLDNYQIKRSFWKNIFGGY